MQWNICRDSWLWPGQFLIEIGTELTCLLAKIKSTASLNSSSASILINSSLASPILSLSLLSTTKIKPCNDNDMSFIRLMVIWVLGAPVYFGSSAAREAWSCLDLPHPTPWNWCFCIPLFLRWTLWGNKKVLLVSFIEISDRKNRQVQQHDLLIGIKTEGCPNHFMQL